MARNKYPEQTVDRILDAALQLFSEKGYESTTIQDIVDSLHGLTRGAIYHHFKSKEEILDAVTQRLSDSYLVPYSELPKSLTGLEKLQRIFLDALRLEIENEGLFINMLYLMEDPHFLQQQIFTVVDSARNMEPLLREGIADGSLSIREEDISHVAQTLLLQLNIWCLPPVFPANTEQLYDRFVFLRGLFEKMGAPVMTEEVMLAARQFANLCGKAAEKRAKMAENTPNK